MLNATHTHGQNTIYLSQTTNFVCLCSFWGRPPLVGGAQWFGAAGSARCLSLSFCYRCARGGVVRFWVRCLSSAAARARRSGLPSPSNVHRHARRQEITVQSPVNTWRLASSLRAYTPDAVATLPPTGARLAPPGGGGGLLCYSLAPLGRRAPRGPLGGTVGLLQPAVKPLAGSGVACRQRPPRSSL